MAVVLDATVGGANSNSYISLEDAEAYFETRMPAATNWSATPAPSDENKKKALITATRLIDQMVEWSGEITADTQALQWPRQDMVDARGVDIDTDVIPAEVGYAVCELADQLLATDRSADLTTAGISGLSVGSISIEFSDSAPPTRKVLPEIAWEFIRRWCTERQDGGSGSSRLSRG